jgi:hypothetical protein
MARTLAMSWAVLGMAERGPVGFPPNRGGLLIVGSASLGRV